MPASQPLTGIRENSFASLAKTFGTPLYIYDGDRIINQIQKLRTAFSRMDVKIKFAAKALTNISVLKLMRRQGIGVDVVSIQEVQIARRAGFTPQEIMFTPSGVDPEEIAEAVAIGVNINLDNLSILEKFGQQYGSSYPCGLRLNPHIMAGGNLKISTGHAHSKFGISVQQIGDIHRLREQYKIQIRGLHIHTGSEITETAVFAQMATLLFELAGQFPELQFLDFGGGFKVAYKAGDKVSDIDAIGAALAPMFDAYQQKHGRKLELWIEPGKYLVSECGYLLVKVNVVKPTPTITFAGVNSGLNHLIRPMMYDAYHEIVNVSNPDGKLKTYNVVGNICETDTLGADRSLPEVREGDLLVLCNAGAYGYSMASNYNSRLRPAEVLVVGSEAKLIRERDTLEQILQGQIDIFP
ncbi:MAG: diaminopimelate decarboxylase [Cyclobacteriaceae bacterium]|jgi:diaminopimelate decarboxylase|nr:diaminopimelate decarboxylase [Cytophagales bacterium]HNP76907.1 diaminopimelate decarboxylase [Cyclobacteriaceae bacterium]